MVTFREVVNTFRELGLSGKRPVIVHASLSAVGEIRGGAETVLGALLPAVSGVLAPTFTFRTMLIPETGPEHNNMLYGSGKDANRMAEFFQPDMPADSMMGVLPEMIRTRAGAFRSSHPILSFSGIQVQAAIQAQTLSEPLAPIEALCNSDGAVLLIGVDHTVNTSIHYAEQLAGRKQFVRWALTPQGVRECPHFPGCSLGFEQAAPHLETITRTARLGNTTVRLLPLAPMIEILTDLLRQDPLALLCHRSDCRCEDVRQSLAAQS